MSCSVLSKMGETNFLALFCPQTLTQRPDSHLFSCAIYFTLAPFLGSPPTVKRVGVGRYREKRKHSMQHEDYIWFNNIIK